MSFFPEVGGGNKNVNILFPVEEVTWKEVAKKTSYLSSWLSSVLEGNSTHSIAAHPPDSYKSLYREV